ncbi:Hypothetical protein FKW44_011109 [Caligus rogercresseyi]|uniref:Uncharacterized protein n=1 Tax=Caligus rogercresseyi TaxID=217165 RepID=A0A7T8HIJ8_CALRO|nr:Hypothetical protein FKW44_011109 [Caligus rogercresseyi]
MRGSAITRDLNHQQLSVYFVLFIDILLTLLFLSLFVHGEETRLTNCDEEDTLEAKTAFKNCVDSSKAPILENTESFKESGLNSLCERLNNLFSTCEEERITLMECTSEAQVENVIEAHMTSIGDILESLLRDMDVKSCSVFNNEGRSDEEYLRNMRTRMRQKKPLPKMLLLSRGGASTS